MLSLGSVTTVKKYIDYLEASWLAQLVPVYDFSVKRQIIAAKKSYIIDTGFVKAVGFSFADTTSHLMENSVYLALRRRFKEIYYYKTISGFEIDFFIPESKTLIQVAQNMTSDEVRSREFRAFAEAETMLKQNGLNKIVITESQTENMQEQDGSIKIWPLYAWLLYGNV